MAGATVTILSATTFVFVLYSTTTVLGVIANGKDQKAPESPIVSPYKLGDCNGLVENSQSGQLASPGHPRGYGNNAYCKVTINVAAGFNIMFKFLKFNMEESYYCRKDFVKLEDLKTSRESEKFCGTMESPRIWISDTNSVQVVFTSNSLYSYSGYIMEYTALNSSLHHDYYDGCNGYISTLHGELQSPNFPSSYPNQLHCTTIFNVSSGLQLRFEFLEFILEPGDCDLSDYIQFTDLVTGRKTRKLCGEIYYDFGLLFESNIIEVTLKTSKQYRYKGFRIAYAAVPTISEAFYDGCNGMYTNATGNVTSPNYPNFHDDNMRCLIAVKVTAGQRILFAFHDFRLEDGQYGCSEADHVQFKDMSTQQTSEKFCGSRGQGRRWLSDSNTASVSFSSNCAGRYAGFSLSYKAVDSSFTDGYDGCNGIITNVFGTLTSPNYPNSYNQMQRCTMKLQMPPGMQIQLVLSYIDLGQTSNQCYDVSLKFVGLSGPKDEKSFCSRYSKGTVLVSYSNTVELTFQTGKAIHKGFQLKYAALHKADAVFDDGCNAKYIARRGFLASPNFPANYFNNEFCEMTVEVPKGLIIRFKFHEFLLEDSEPLCKADSVFILDVHGKKRSEMYCGWRGKGRIWHSSSSMAVVKFQSDCQSTFKGFRLEFTAVNPSDTDFYDGCNGFVNASSGILTSLNYPHVRPSRLSCVVSIRAKANHHLKFTIDSFELDGNGGECYDDYVQISDPTSTYVSRKLCGHIPRGAHILLASSQAQLKFLADDSRHSQGFQISFESVDLPVGDYYDGCNGLLHAPSGEITSVNYPSFYLNNIVCVVNLVANSSSTFLFEFVEFQIDPATSRDGRCKDFVQIKDSVLGQRTAELCGLKHRGMKWISASNNVTVTFSSDASLAYQGFRLLFTAVQAGIEFSDGCNGRTRAPHGELKSPLYPRSYPPSKNCRFTIAGPDNHYIRIEFLDLRIAQRRGSCVGDYLELIDSNGTKSTGPLCGSGFRARFWYSDSNVVHVDFVTDRSYSSAGYHLKYISVNNTGRRAARYDGCNGVMDDPVGFVMSPGYPYDFLPNLHCNTTVIGPAGMVLRLTLNALYLEPEYGCGHDSLELHDGALGTGKLCGSHFKGLVYTAESNVVNVIFKSNQHANSGGFNVSYVSINETEKEFQDGCNGYSSSLAGMFTTPNFTSVERSHTTCNQQLTVAKGKRILLHFQNAGNLQVTDDCVSTSYVMIRDLASHKLSPRLCGALPRSVMWLSDSNAVSVMTVNEVEFDAATYSVAYTAVKNTFRLPDLATSGSSAAASDCHCGLFRVGMCWCSNNAKSYLEADLDTYDSFTQMIFFTRTGEM